MILPAVRCRANLGTRPLAVEGSLVPRNASGRMRHDEEKEWHTVLGEILCGNLSRWHQWKPNTGQQHGSGRQTDSGVDRADEPVC